MNKTIEKIYTDFKNSAGHASVAKLYNAVKQIDKGIKLSDIKKFLATQPSYTLYKRNPNKFKRRPYIVISQGHTVQADVAHFGDYKTTNDGVAYLLFIIDMFSRYLYVYPLKNIKAGSVSKALDSFFSGNIYKYKKIFTDRGVEFLSKQAKEIYKKHDVLWYTIFNQEIKAGLVERCIQTIRILIGKYLVQHNTENYLQALPGIIEKYNNSVHTSLLKRTPLNVHLMTDNNDIFKLKQQMYIKRLQKQEPVSVHLRKGTTVRIKSARSSQNIFRKSHYIVNTKELFKIDSVNKKFTPVTYKLRDLDGGLIEGYFYKQELVKAINTGFYSIEVIKTRKRGGKKQFLVKYIDYPNSRNRWTSEEQLSQIKK